MNTIYVGIIVTSWAIIVWALVARREADTARAGAALRAGSLEAENASLRRQIGALRPHVDELNAIKAQRSAALAKARAVRTAKSKNPAQAKAAAKKK